MLFLPRRGKITPANIRMKYRRRRLKAAQHHEALAAAEHLHDAAVDNDLSAPAAGGGSNWVSSVIHCAITVQHVCTVRRASHQRAATTAASATAAAGKPAAPQRRRRAGLEDAKAGERIGPYTAKP